MYTDVNESGGFLKYRSWDISDAGPAYACYCLHDINCYHQNLYEALGIHLPESIKNSVRKRQAEFLSGRFAASRALGLLGLKGFNIGIGEHRNPVWPENVIASISHCDARAICMASLKDQKKMIGVDIENWLTGQSARQISYLVAGRQEKSYFETLSLPFEQCVTIAFSAKESLYKAIFPSVNRYLDFDVARVENICQEAGTVSLVITRDLSDQIKQDTEYTCYVKTDNVGVMTFVI